MLQCRENSLSVSLSLSRNHSETLRVPPPPLLLSFASAVSWIFMNPPKLDKWRKEEEVQSELAGQLCLLLLPPPPPLVQSSVVSLPFLSHPVHTHTHSLTVQYSQPEKLLHYTVHILLHYHYATLVCERTHARSRTDPLYKFFNALPTRARLASKLFIAILINYFKLNICSMCGAFVCEIFLFIVLKSLRILKYTINKPEKIFRNISYFS